MVYKAGGEVDRAGRFDCGSGNVCRTKKGTIQGSQGGWKFYLHRMIFAHRGMHPFFPNRWSGIVFVPFSQKWKNLWSLLVCKRSTKRSAWDVLSSFLTERGAGYSGGISSPNSAFYLGVPPVGTPRPGELSARGVCFLPWIKEGRSFPPTPGPLRGKEVCVLLSRGCTGGIILSKGWKGVQRFEFSAINPIFNLVEYEDDRKC